MKKDCCKHYLLYAPHAVTTANRVMLGFRGKEPKVDLRRKQLYEFAGGVYTFKSPLTIGDGLYKKEDLVGWVHIA